MHDWLEEVSAPGALADPLEAGALAEAGIKTGEVVAGALAHLRHGERSSCASRFSQDVEITQGRPVSVEQSLAGITPGRLDIRRL